MTGYLLRLVIDAVNECNLRCSYCHPGQTWRSQQLDVPRVAEACRAAEASGVLEVVLTGGEITLHHDFEAVLDTTHLLERAAACLITNATTMTRETSRMIAASNLSRVCTSVDGVDNQTHGSARGKNLRRVLAGLDLINDSGKPVTVITVVHRGNWRRVIELSDFLAARGLAAQHHLCAPSYSGEARENYPRLALAEHEFHRVQELVDRHHHRLAAAGLYLTFNSTWPATGHRTLTVNPGRTITLQQLSEQLKSSLANVRPDGQFRLQAATWGREVVGGAAVLGSMNDVPVADLLARANQLVADGAVRQLPREVEARHKFQLGADADRARTDHLIGGHTATAPDLSDLVVETAPLAGIEEHWILNNPLPFSQVIDDLTRRPGDHRIGRHPTGTVLVFDRRRSMTTLLRPAEWAHVAASIPTTGPTTGRTIGQAAVEVTR